jgi:hypothetical protein
MYPSLLVMALAVCEVTILTNPPDQEEYPVSFEAKVSADVSVLLYSVAVNGH